MRTTAAYETKTLEPLGLAAGTFDGLGIGDVIDGVVAQAQDQRLVSVRMAVKAIVLNALGFANRRLCLTLRFFKNEAVERWRDAGVTADVLNDDALGRALDSLHAVGVTRVMSVPGALTACTELRADASLLLAPLREGNEGSVSEELHHGQRGRPDKDSDPERITYRLAGALATPVNVFAERVEQGLRFILAGNDSAGKELSDAQALAKYKVHARAKRGFRPLKDPMFLARTLGLKSPARIMALLMVMTASLLVRAGLKHPFRNTLAASDATVPDQKRKTTGKPTAEWVVELFLDTHPIHHTRSRAPACHAPTNSHELYDNVVLGGCR